MPQPIKDKPVSPQKRFATGQAYEQKALVFFLEQNPGSKVLARNLKRKGFELDAVFETKNQELVFLEVRMRTNPTGYVEDSIDAKKRQRIEKGARYFLGSYRGRANSIRFSVITFGPQGIQYWPTAWT